MINGKLLIISGIRLTAKCAMLTQRAQRKPFVILSEVKYPVNRCRMINEILRFTQNDNL